jgi:hypothetical protein
MPVAMYNRPNASRCSTSIARTSAVADAELGAGHRKALEQSANPEKQQPSREGPLSTSRQNASRRDEHRAANQSPCPGLARLRQR